MDQRRYVLPEDAIPTQWYNIAADLPSLPPPPLHPGTGQPIGPDDLAPLFPMALIMQEVSTERWIAIPERGARDLPHVAADAALPRARARAGARHAGADLLQVRGRQPGRQPQAQHRRRRRPTTTKQEGVKRLATETGAGQWGSALCAWPAQFFGLECKVYMVRVSYDQKPYRRSMMETWGAECVASPSTETNAGRDDARASDPDSHRQPRHRHQRGRRGRGHARGHQVLARQRAQPRAACTRR